MAAEENLYLSLECRASTAHVGDSRIYSCLFDRDPTFLLSEVSGVNLLLGEVPGVNIGGH